ncbi:MAG: hypothetical protein ABIS51_10110 [Sphingomonas sp.]
MRKRTGCLLAASVPVFGLLLFIASFGLVRTSAMKTTAASTDAFTLTIVSAADADSSQGAWPVTYSDVYQDDGRIRGRLNRKRSQSGKFENLKLVISAPSGQSEMTLCPPSEGDTCYLHADLRPARLQQGIVVVVLDAETGKPVSPPISFSFARRVTYSSTWWEGLMSV